MSLEFNAHDLEVAVTHAPSVAAFGADASTWAPEDIQSAICQALNIPLVEVEVEHVDLAAMDDPAMAQLSRRYKIFPTFCQGMSLVVAMVRPWDESILVRIRQMSHQEVRVMGMRLAVFERVQSRVGLQLMQRAKEKARSSAVVSRIVSRPVSWNMRNRTPISAVTQLVQLSAELGASDIILTPGEHWMDVRIKASGKTEVLPPIETRYAKQFLNAFMELGLMSIRESRKIQNGKATFSIPGKGDYELRLASAPTVFGETLVARLQNRQEQLERMKKLPFTGRQLEIVQAALRQKEGLFITTGPVNSGKTTLMYSCLRQIDPSIYNVRTLEDPPEINLPWVGQIPVDEANEVNFSAGLRSLLRQSPDIILVGEIRSPEVCGTAIEAVLTGHLIFATIHATDALGVVPRLLDLGVSGHKIAAALLITVGQRLVPSLCPHCRAPSTVSPAVAKHFRIHELEPPEQVWEHTGCPLCDGTGYRGRVPLFELFCPNDAMRDIISSASDHHFERAKLHAEWVRAGGAPLGKHALMRVAAGEIDYAEAEKHDPIVFQNIAAGG